MLRLITFFVLEVVCIVSLTAQKTSFYFGSTQTVVEKNRHPKEEKLQKIRFQIDSSFEKDSTLIAQSLPVTWISFTVSQESWNVAIVDFFVSREINNQLFEIEYSEDGFQFVTIGIINSAAGNNSKLKHYQFLHQLDHGFLNAAFYRIKQVDFDAKFSYSKVVEMPINTDWEYYLITPNPFTEQITVSMFSKNTTENTFRVYDMFGQCVFNEIRYVLGQKAIMLNLFSLPNGMYTLEIIESNSSNKVYQRIIKI